MFKTGDINVIDPKKVFELNLDMKVTVEDIPGTPDKLLVIDNFYKNPELVEEIIKGSPASNVDEYNDSAFNGYRITMYSVIQNKIFYNILTNILKNAFDMNAIIDNKTEIVNKDRSFVINIYKEEPLLSNPNRRQYPHWDHTLFSSLLYFYNDPEGKMGTGLFKHKKSGLNHLPYDDNQRRAVCKNYGMTMEELDTMVKENEDAIASLVLTDDELCLTESDDEFELLHKTIPMYNRLCVFLGSTLHSPIVDYDQLKENDMMRVNQVMFLDPMAKRV